jgi:hypothetical protein
VPAVAKTVAMTASGVGMAAAGVKAAVREDMASTYVQMTGKYCLDLAMAPLAFRRVSDFLDPNFHRPAIWNKTKQLVRCQRRGSWRH